MSLHRYRNAPLAAGALLGIAIAATGLLRAPDRAPGLPDDVVATVNGEPIRRSEYESALAALASERRSGTLDPSLQKHVLDRLIEEELLVQAALELGLAHRDRRVRADLSSAAIGFLLDAPEAREPSEADLRAYFEEHKSELSTGGRMAVQIAYLARRPSEADPALLARSRALRADWQSGQAFSSDPPPVPLPRGELPARTLEQYLGPTAARAAGATLADEVSDPVLGPSGALVLRVESRSEGTTPAFESVREEVAQIYKRRAADERLRRFLEDRRARARIAVREDPGT